MSYKSQEVYIKTFREGNFNEKFYKQSAERIKEQKGFYSRYCNCRPGSHQYIRLSNFFKL